MIHFFAFKLMYKKQADAKVSKIFQETGGRRPKARMENTKNGKRKKKENNDWEVVIYFWKVDNRGFQVF